MTTRRAFLRGALAAAPTFAFAPHGWPRARGAPFDLVLRGGTVVDGTGAPGRPADVAIRGDRIAEVGDIGSVEAARVIDVRGLVVAPGFVDAHAHSDLRRQPTAASKVLQGVTIDVCGPDGGSPFPDAADADEPKERACADFAAWRQQHGAIAIDIGAYVGHGTVRQHVLGPVGRAPSGDELAAMRRLLATAFEQGALGLSSGLEYFPGNAAATDELVQLCKVAAAHDRPYVTHIRNEDDRVVEAVDEAIAIARRSGAPLLVSHLKIGGSANWPKLEAVLARIEAARKDHEVHADCYPYDAWHTSLATNFPAWSKEGGRFVERLQDPAERERMRAETEAAVAANGGWGTLMLGNGLAAVDRDLLGQRLDAAARERSVEPFQLACDLLTRGNVSILGFGIREDQMDTILCQPWCLVASDGSAAVASGRTGHPRSFGTFPRVFRRHVRELGRLSVEEAVRKMTSLPATVLRLADRGTIAAGRLASLVAFDAAAFTDRATWLEPQRYAEGVRFLVVNGAVAVDAGTPTGVRAGRVVARQAAPAPRVQR
ncbi:MAG: D-aminoacylase [Planctomycetes bacterium]|nr:D-aminoacylase [Planctomycetota bacterium]